MDRDIFKYPLNEANLKAIIGDRAISDILAINSPSFKALGIEPSRLSDKEILSLMIGEPRLIRRPLSLIGNQLIIGPNQANIQKALDQAYPPK